MWTDHEDRQLIRLWPTSSASKIAAKLGKTRNAVIGRMHRINRTYVDRPSKWKLRRRQLVAEAKKQRHEREVAALAKFRKELDGGVQRNAAIKHAFRDGARLVAIGNLVGVTRQAVSLIVRQG